MVSLVVVVSDDEQAVGRRIDACAAVASAVGPAETIVVNDGSTDGTWQEIASAQERNRRVGALDLAEHYGLARAMLEGARRASGSLLSFVDPRAIPTRDALLELMTACSAEGVICATLATADWKRGGVRHRHPAAVQALLERMAQRATVPVAVVRRDEAVAGLERLMDGTPRVGVVALWYPPGESVGTVTDANAALPSPGLDPSAVRLNGRRAAKLAVPAAIVGVVLVGSGLGPTTRPPTARIETAVAPGGPAFVERNPAIPRVTEPASGERKHEAETTKHDSSGRNDAGSKDGRSERGGRSTSGPSQPTSHTGGSASGGGGSGGSGGSGGAGGPGGASSGSGESDGSGGGSGGTGGGSGDGGGGTGGGGGSGGGGGGGSGGGGGTDGSGPGNGAGKGHANGHSHAPGQQKTRDSTGTPSAPPKQHGGGDTTHGHSGDHPQGPPADHGEKGHGNSKP